MYLEHFGLAVHPFGMSPRLDFLYKSKAFEESMAHLVYGLDNSEAIVLITGPIGSGKTLSLQSFFENLGDNYQTALVTNTQVTTTELLKLVLEDLGVKMGPGWDKSDLLIAFKDILINAGMTGQRVVVVIDEAQNLGPDVLEEVRLLTNLGQGMEQPVQLILAGQPELKTLVYSPKLEQLRQRIRVHYEFENLRFEEMVGYVKHRLAVAGCHREVFEPAALEKLYRISGGVPRLVNTHAGEALLSAFVAKRPMVKAEDVEERKDQVGGDVAPIPELSRPVPPPTPEPVSRPAKTPEPEPYTSPAYTRSTNRGRGGIKGGGRRRAWYVFGALALVTLVAYYIFFTEGPLPFERQAVLGLSQGVSGGPNESSAVMTPESSVVIEDTLVVTADDSLGIIVPGTGAEVETADAAPEEEEPAPVEDPAPAVRPSSPSTGEYGYFVHVASFRDSMRSHRLCERLETRDFSCVVQNRNVGGVDWYRVYVGPEAVRDSALVLAHLLLKMREIEYYNVERFPLAGK